MALGGGLERFEQDVGVVGVTAQAASAHQQRAQRGDAVVGGQREQHVAGGAGGGVQDAGERVVGALGGELGVAQDEPADGFAAVLELVSDDVHEPERLGLRAGQQPVDLGRAAADALAGEVEPQLAQRGRDRLVAVGGLARRIAGEPAQRVVLQQHEPVVEVGLAAVLLAAGRAGRDPQVGREQEADAGAGELRAALLELRPAQLRLVLGGAPAVVQAADHPLGEVAVVQVRDQLAEARVVLGEPVAFDGQRLGEQRELLVGREVTVADDGRGGDGEVDGAEQRVVELGLGFGEADRRRGGEADHVRVLRQLLQHGADHVAPQAREVVALVEQDDADAHLRELLHARAGGLAEQVPELHAGVLAARDLPLEGGADA